MTGRWATYVRRQWMPLHRLARSSRLAVSVGVGGKEIVMEGKHATAAGINET